MRDNTTKHTLENVLKVPEVVIHVVGHDLVEQMSLASTEYAKGVNEFVKAGLTAVPSNLVAPPRVKEAPVAFECKVLQVVPLGDQGGAGNLVICEALQIHLDENILDASGAIAPLKLDPVARLGGNWYTRVTADSLFQIPKPLMTLGIGVDQIPEEIRNSPVLSGNNLGRLGNVEQLPSPEEIALFLPEKTWKISGAAFGWMQNPGPITYTAGPRKSWRPAMWTWPGRYFCKKYENKKLSD